VAQFGRAEAKDRAPRRHAGRDAGDGVFDHGAAFGVYPQRRGGCQVHIRERLGARQLVAAEDAVFKEGHEPALLQLKLDLEAVCAGRAGDSALVGGVDLAHGLDGAVHGQQGLDQAFIAAAAKLVQPGFGDRLAGVGLDGGGLVDHGLADKKAHALGRAELPALLFQHVAQYAVGNRLAVDQHAITVE
jgi:hypothetical protein